MCFAFFNSWSDLSLKRVSSSIFSIKPLVSSLVLSIVLLVIWTSFYFKIGYIELISVNVNCNKSYQLILNEMRCIWVLEPGTITMMCPICCSANCMAWPHAECCTGTLDNFKFNCTYKFMKTIKVIALQNSILLFLHGPNDKLRYLQAVSHMLMKAQLVFSIFNVFMIRCLIWAVIIYLFGSYREFMKFSTWVTQSSDTL